MIWFKYMIHDYMDMYPEYGYQLLESKEQAKQWENHMNSNYSGGITRIIGPARQEDILKYIKGMELDELTMSNINNIEFYEV